MNQRETADKLTRLHFVGKHPYARLAKDAGLSVDTIRRACTGDMSALTQTRLTMLFKVLPETFHVEPPKRKPGHKKRYLIRYMNLRYWIAEIESVCGKNPKFKLKKRYDLSTTERSGYVVTKLDFILKWYLFKIFGEELKKKKVYFGDCFAAEKWVERIVKLLPHLHKDLMKKLQHRKGLNERR